MKLLSCFVVAMLIIGPLLQPLTVWADTTSGVVSNTTTSPSPTDVLTNTTAPVVTTGTGVVANQGDTTLQQTISASATNQPNPTGTDGIGCSLTTQGIAICISNLVYFVMVGLFSNIAYICAYFFDIAVQVSLNSMAYSLDFISTGWTTVRDLANMAFLFLLIYIAFIVMFKSETSNTLRMLAAVVVVALLVNFSFFFTRVAIDGGNILAVQFYNAIQAPLISATASNSTGSNAASIITSYGSNGGAKDLTASIMNALNVQSLTSNTSFQQFAQQNPNAFGNAMYTLIALSLVYIATGIMFALLAGSFLFAGAKFMMRTVALMFLIVASPAAFVAAAVAKTKEGGTNWFTKWFTALIKFSAYPAIYLFMFFVLSQFMQGIAGGTLFTGLFNGAAAQGSAAMATSIATVAVRMGFIMAMMYLALSVSEMIVTEGSQAAGAFQKKIMGGLTGGIVGFAGRNTFGRFGTGMAQRAAERGEKSRVGDFLAKRSYDFRNTPILNRGFQLANDKLPAVKNALPLSTGTAADIKPWQPTKEMKAKAKEAEKKTAAANTNNKAPVAANTNTPSPQPPRPTPPSVPAAAALAIPKPAVPVHAANDNVADKIENLASVMHAGNAEGRRGVKEIVHALQEKAETPVVPNSNARIAGGAATTRLPLAEQPPTPVHVEATIESGSLHKNIAQAIKNGLAQNKINITVAAPTAPTNDNHLPQNDNIKSA